MALSSDAHDRAVAFCQVHGLFDMAEASATPAPCPECGRDSRVLDGQDKAVMLRVNGIVASGASIEAVLDMRNLLERVQRGEVGPDAAIAEAVKIDPQFGRALTRALKIEAWAIPALISTLSLYFRLKDDYSGKAQIGNLVRIIERQKEPLERLRVALGIRPAVPPAPPPAPSPSTLPPPPDASA